MSVIITQMDGLPASADSHAVILAVRKVLQKLKIRFWVHDFSFSEETNTNKCKIKFFAKHEATKAIEKITSKPQTIIGVPCDLKVSIISENAVDDSKKEGQASRRDRSRSPISKEEANINKELEQLKKEKEELEKRKSELLKKKMDIDQKDVKTEDKNSQKESIKPTKMHHSILPKYTAAEVAIMDEMKPLTKPYAQARYYQNFMQRLHVELRIKLAILIESHNKLQKLSPPDQIVKAYRAKYPKNEDEAMIETIITQVKMAFWAYKAKNKDGANSELYEYDESEEEGTAVDEGIIDNEEFDIVDDNKMETDEDDASSITKDIITPTTEDVNKTEDGDRTEDVNKTEDSNKSEHVNMIEDGKKAEDGNKTEDGNTTEDGNKTENGNKTEDGNKIETEDLFEGGTDWNEEIDKVPAVTLT